MDKQEESWEKDWDAQWTRPVESDYWEGKRDMMSEAQKKFIRDLRSKDRDTLIEKMKMVKRKVPSSTFASEMDEAIFHESNGFHSALDSVKQIILEVYQK